MFYNFDADEIITEREPKQETVLVRSIEAVTSIISVHLPTART